MTPERISEMREDVSSDGWPVLRGEEVLDLLDTAEREAGLRAACEQMLAVQYVTVGATGGQLSPQYMAAQTALRDALRAKGGEW